MMTLMTLLIIIGFAIVVASRSPYFGIFGVLLQALGYAGISCVIGAPFFGLLLILIYIGGMMVVFLFSTILSAERHPMSGWVEAIVVVLLSILVVPFMWSLNTTTEAFLSTLPLINESSLGNAFDVFGEYTLLVGLILLWALVVVLFFGFEHSRSSLRKL